MRRHERQERHDSAFAVVVGAHEEHDVLDGDDRVSAQMTSETTPRTFPASGAIARRRRSERVERAGADVAEDDAECPQRQQRRRLAGGMVRMCVRGWLRLDRLSHRAMRPLELLDAH